MDQIKMGRFIFQQRKEINLTQKQLAEKLGVSDKTISKWENGDRMPDIALLQLLCQTLEIDVNELLSGEKINQDEYVSKANENFVELVRDIHESKTEDIYVKGGFVAGIILVVVSLLGMAIALGGVVQLPYYLDYRTAFFLIGLYILGLVFSGSLKDYLSAYRIAWSRKKYEKEIIRKAINVMRTSSILLLSIGAIVSFCAVVAAFGWLNETANIGPSLSQAVLAALYTALIEFVQVFCIQALNKYAN